MDLSANFCYNSRVRILLFIFLFEILAMLSPAGSACSDPLNYERRVTNGIPVNIISVDLKDPGIYVTPALAPYYQEVAECYMAVPFEDMLTLYEPAAAINGPFFDVASGRVVCALARDGALISEGELGSAILMDKKGNAHMHLTAGMRARKMDWRNATWGVSCGPTLVYRGQLFYHPGPEGFTSSSLFRPALRSAIGITSDGILLLVTTSRGITLEQLAKLMLDIGAWHAINLDGGSSCAMAFEGKVITATSRLLPAYLLVYRKKDDAPYLNYPDIGKFLERRASIRARVFYLNAYPAFSQGMYYESLSLALKACELDEDDATYFDMAARCNEALGRYKEAAHMHTRCACIMMHRGNRDEALKHIALALSRDPENAEALETRSLIEKSPEILPALMRLFSSDGRKTGEALEIMKSAANNPTVALFVAQACRLKGDVGKAAEYCRIAGEMYLARGNSFEGYLAAKQAVEFEPEVIAYRELLLKAARSKGDDTTAALQQLIIEAMGIDCDHFPVRKEER